MDDVDRRTLKEDAIAGGDAARRAFELLWKSFYGRILAFARSYRGLPDRDAEDEASEAMIAAFASLARYDPARPLEPWIYRVAANRFSRAAGNSRRSKADSLLIEPAEERIDHVASLVAKDLVGHCAAAIEGLPEIDRRIALLSFAESMDSASVGKVLGMPAGSVRWRLTGIRRSIRRAVGEDDR